MQVSLTDLMVKVKSRKSCFGSELGVIPVN